MWIQAKFPNSSCKSLQCLPYFIIFSLEIVAYLVRKCPLLSCAPDSSKKVIFGCQCVHHEGKVQMPILKQGYFNIPNKHFQSLLPSCGASEALIIEILGTIYGKQLSNACVHHEGKVQMPILKQDYFIFPNKQFFFPNSFGCFQLLFEKL